MFIVQKVGSRWMIRETWREQKLLPVGCLIEGSIQYGRDDEPGAFCTRHIPENQRSYEVGRTLLGSYKTKRAAEKMAFVLKGEAHA